MVTLDVHKVSWKLDEQGRYAAFAEMSLPCPGCGKDYNFTHLMEAPVLFLRNLRRCTSCGGEYQLKDESIEYIELHKGDPRIEVSAKLVCVQCAARERKTWDIPSPEVTTLRGAGEIDVDLSANSVHPHEPSESSERRFKIALSFPGSRRAFVRAVAHTLAKTYGTQHIFYDEFYRAELARPGLDVYLEHIYRRDARLIVVFLCDGYDRSEWCGLEFRAIRDLIKAKNETSIMFLKFDDVEISGLFSIDGYLNIAELTAEQVAEYIDRRARFKSH